MTHIRKRGTFFTFCGESIDDVFWSYYEDDSDCSSCSIQYLEGEIDYVKRVNREEEDWILALVSAVLIVGAFTSVVLLFCLVVFE